MTSEWCQCGHGQAAHEYSMRPACAVLMHKRRMLVADRCPCDSFKPDNLRLLEDLNEIQNG